MRVCQRVTSSVTGVVSWLLDRARRHARVVASRSGVLRHRDRTPVVRAAVTTRGPFLRLGDADPDRSSFFVALLEECVGDLDRLEALAGTDRVGPAPPGRGLHGLRSALRPCGCAGWKGRPSVRLTSYRAMVSPRALANVSEDRTPSDSQVREFSLAVPTRPGGELLASTRVA